MLDQAVLLFLNLRVLLARLLHQQLDVAELAEVEIPLSLKTLNRLLERVIFLLQGRRAGSPDALGDPRASSWCGTSPDGTRRRSRSGRDTSGGRGAGSTSSSNGIVVAAREVLVPVPLGPLKELKVVLHLALDQLFDIHRAVDAMSREAVYCEGLLARATQPRRVFLTLEDLEVLEVRVFGVHVELDSGHGNVEVDAVEYLAESRTVCHPGSVLGWVGGTEG